MSVLLRLMRRFLAISLLIISLSLSVLAIAAWVHGGQGREHMGKWSLRREGPWLIQRFTGIFPDEGGVFVGRVTERLIEQKYLERGATSLSDFERREWFRGYTGWIGDVPYRLRDWGVLRQRAEFLGFAHDAWDGWPIGSALDTSGVVLETLGWWLLRIPYWFIAVAFGAWPLAVAGSVSRRQLVRRRLRRAAERGVCPVCGYDLRASGGRCPECGSVFVGEPRS